MSTSNATIATPGIPVHIPFTTPPPTSRDIDSSTAPPPLPPRVFLQPELQDVPVLVLPDPISTVYNEVSRIILPSTTTYDLETAFSTSYSQRQPPDYVHSFKSFSQTVDTITSIFSSRPYQLTVFVNKINRLFGKAEITLCERGTAFVLVLAMSIRRKGLLHLGSWKPRYVINFIPGRDYPVSNADRREALLSRNAVIKFLESIFEP